jgi:hypothetical protein
MAGETKDVPDRSGEPVRHDWAWLDEVIGPVDEDFEAAANERPPEQARPSLEWWREDTAAGR